MISRHEQVADMKTEIDELRARLAESEETLRAILGGEVDALVVNAPGGERIYTLDGTDQVYRTLVETMSEGAAALDRGGFILYANRRLAEMLGRPLRQIIGASFQGFLSEEHQATFGKAIMTGEPDGLQADVGFLASDGSSRPVHLSMSLLNLDDVEGLCLVATDMSNHARLQRELAEQAQELIRSNSELERFAYVASHDLQEPLRMVGSFTQLLAKRYKDRLDPDADEFIGFIVDGVSQMQLLITDLLQYSRVGRKTRPFAPTELDEAIARALGNLREAIATHDVSIVRGPLPQVCGDPSQLARLFQNLIANAIKFRSSERPRLAISAESAEAQWIISIADNGIGIEPRHFDRLFVLFQRLHSRSEYPGTGIGLAICKKIVELHGGRIWVESTAGAGACFRFTIPVLGENCCESLASRPNDLDPAG